MMQRSPPAKQKRASPPSSTLPAAPGKESQQSPSKARLVESKAMATPSPSKRLRRPAAMEEADEPHRLRSPHRDHSWSIVERPLGPAQQQYEEYMITSFDHDPEIGLDDDSLQCSYKCRNMMKSDVLVTLDAREKQVGELRALVDKLKAGHATSEEERKKLKRRVAGLEQGLAAAKERETGFYKQRTQQSNSSSELVRTHIARCLELETLLKEEMRKNAEAQARAVALEARAASAEDEKDKEVYSAERKTKKVNQELERLQSDSLYALARANAQLEVEKSRAQGAAEEADAKNAQVQEMEGRMSESLAERLKLEHQIYDIDVHTSLTRSSGTTEADLVIKHLKEELAQCEAEIRDARKLNQKHVNIELLKEQLMTEKSRAERLEASLSNVADLESRVKESERELSAWTDTIGALPGVETREDLGSKFADLQREIIASTTSVGESKAEIARLQTALSLAESAKRQAGAVAEAAEAEAAEAVLNLKRAERKVSHLTRERDGLQAIVVSYDEEERVIASHQSPGTGIANLATPEKAKELRIQQLEMALAEAQHQIRFLSDEVEKSTKGSAEHRHRADSLNLMLADASEKYNMMERETVQLRSEVSLLEDKLARGDSDSSTTKILHMVINPESEIHGQSNIEILRAKLDLHEGQSDGGRKGSLGGASGMEKEKVTALTQRVTALEKREARYKQVFANKISIFREACGLIFGYKVQMNEERDSTTGSSITLFTLQSIYSSGEEEQIQFQFKDGTVEMIANEYTSSPEIQRQVITFMRNYKSIPAFIANLTMELFNKTTLG